MSRALRRLAVPIAVIVAASCLLSACNINWSHIFLSSPHDSAADGTVAVDATDVPGLAVVASDYDFDTTVTRVANAEPATGETLDSSIAQIDLTARAASTSGNDLNGNDFTGNDLNGNDLTGNNLTGNGQTGTTLRATTVLRFIDSDHALALINADRRAALDLPAAVLVYQDRAGTVGVAYDDASYWRARFDLGTAGDALDALTGDLSQVAATASGNAVGQTPDAGSIDTGDGVVAVTSDADFTKTVSRLTEAIDANSGVSEIGTVDWAARAHANGSMIGNNDDSLTVFFLDAGNNAAQLIAGNQTAGIDAPVRIVVSQADNGQVTLYYESASYIASRHAISGRAAAIAALDTTQAQLVDSAAGR